MDLLAERTTTGMSYFYPTHFDLGYPIIPTLIDFESSGAMRWITIR